MWDRLPMHVKVHIKEIAAEDWVRQLRPILHLELLQRAYVGKNELARARDAEHEKARVVTSHAKRSYEEARARFEEELQHATSMVWVMWARQDFEESRDEYMTAMAADLEACDALCDAYTEAHATNHQLHNMHVVVMHCISTGGPQLARLLLRCLEDFVHRSS